MSPPSKLKRKNKKPVIAFDPLSRTFLSLEPTIPVSSSRFKYLDDTSSVAEDDTVSIHGSCSGESESHKDKKSIPAARQETIPGADNDKQEKTQHQRQRERRAQNFQERCSGSCLGESEGHKDKKSIPAARQETIPGADNDKQEKTRLRNEKKHQRQKERRAQKLHERCRGYLMSRKLEALTQKLVAMGFAQERATAALMRYEGKEEESVSWLLKGGEETNDSANQNLDGQNLKLDISNELARLVDLEAQFKCTKKEVERAVVASEGDLEKAAESLRELKLGPPAAAAPKPEETGDPPTALSNKFPGNTSQALTLHANPNPPLILLREEVQHFHSTKEAITACLPIESIDNSSTPQLLRSQPEVEWENSEQITTAEIWEPSAEPAQLSSPPITNEAHYLTDGSEFNSLRYLTENITACLPIKSIDNSSTPPQLLRSQPEVEWGNSEQITTAEIWEPSAEPAQLSSPPITNEAHYLSDGSEFNSLRYLTENITACLPIESIDNSSTPPQLLRSQPEVEWGNSELITTAEIWEPSAEPAQLSSPPITNEARYLTDGSKFNSLQSGPLREPSSIVQIQNPSLHTKQMSVGTISSQAPGWYSANDLGSTEPSSGFLPQSSSSKSFKPSDVTLNPTHPQVQYQQQQPQQHFVPGNTNISQSRPSALPFKTAAANLGLFSRASSSQSGVSPPPVDWNVGKSMPYVDYSKIDWSMDKTPPVKPGGLFQGQQKNTHLSESIPYVDYSKIDWSMDKTPPVQPGGLFQGQQKNTHLSGSNMARLVDAQPFVPSRHSNVNKDPIVPSRSSNVNTDPVVPSRPSNVNTVPVVPSRPSNVNAPARHSNVNRVPYVPSRHSNANRVFVPFGPSNVNALPIVPPRPSNVNTDPIVPPRPSNVNIVPVVSSRPSNANTLPFVPLRPSNVNALPFVPARLSNVNRVSYVQSRHSNANRVFVPFGPFNVNEVPFDVPSRASNVNRVPMAGLQNEVASETLTRGSREGTFQFEGENFFRFTRQFVLTPPKEDSKHFGDK